MFEPNVLPYFVALTFYNGKFLQILSTLRRDIWQVSCLDLLTQFVIRKQTHGSQTSIALYDDEAFVFRRREQRFMVEVPVVSDRQGNFVHSEIAPQPEDQLFFGLVLLEK